MNAPSRRRLGQATLVAVALAVATGCAQAGVAPTPTAVTSHPASTPTAVPPSASPNTSPSAPVADAPIPEGDYTTGPITADMMVAAVEAHGLDAAMARQFVEGEGFTVHETVTVRLRDGVLTLLQSMDGARPAVGWQGTYAFADDETMIAESGGYPITYAVRWEGDQLHLKVLKDLHPEAFDLIAQVAIYESAPFTAVP
jgi:hypothetical protein